MQQLLVLSQDKKKLDSLLPHLSPLGWEHINLTGDYSWALPLRGVFFLEEVM